MLMKTNHSKSMGCCKSVVQREIHINTGLPKKEEKSQIDNLTYQLINQKKKNKQKLKSAEGRKS